MAKSSTSVYVTDKRFPGVRKRYIGITEGFGEDWSFFIQYRDKLQGNKVVMVRLGTASEGWNTQKAFAEKESRLFHSEGLVLDQKRKKRMEVHTEATSLDVTLADIWHDYCLYNKDEKARSIKDYTKLVKKIPFFSSMPIAKIKTRTIQDLRRQLERTLTSKGTPLKPQSVKHVLAFIKILVRYGVKRELCEPRPDLVFEMPTFDNQVTEFMTSEQLELYKKALDEDHDVEGVAFLKIALYTGMRPSAILKLKWTDLDLENNLITLQADAAKNKTGTKIPLPEMLKDVVAHIPRSIYSVYLFEQRGFVGKPRTTFYQTARRVKERAGLPKDFRPVYMLRHNFATHLASSGQVDIYTIQKLMTHKTSSMTQRYAHVMDNTLKKGSKVVEDIFNRYNF